MGTPRLESRGRLGDGIMGSVYKEQEAVAMATQSLLRAILREHPAIMRAHERAGRQVVRP